MGLISKEIYFKEGMGISNPFVTHGAAFGVIFHGASALVNDVSLRIDMGISKTVLSVCDLIDLCSKNVHCYEV